MKTMFLQFKSPHSDIRQRRGAFKQESPVVVVRAFLAGRKFAWRQQGS
jgi:hypothetical protein